MSVFATQFLRKSTSQLLTMCALALAIFSFIFAPSALAADNPALHAQTSANSQGAPAASVFRVVNTPHPNPNGFQNLLVSVSGSSASDIWAVGQSVIHYDGSKWTAFSAPHIDGGEINELTGVADISPDNVWAVGYLNLNEQNPNQLIEHYDGSAWRINRGPKLPPTDVPILESVTATSASDIWATGGITINNQDEFPLFEHFDGTSWTATAAGFSETLMFGVSADATNDVWAVGTGGSALHYDGKTWSPIPVPIPGSGENALFGVKALAPNDAWAAGFYVKEANQTRPEITLIEHWDGASWRFISSPNPGGSNKNNFLRGITAVSAKDVWAYGTSIDISTDLASTLVLHWDGTRWAVVPSPDPVFKFRNDFLNGGAVVPTGDLWLVGGETVFRSLALHATGQ
jgi:hypothetical protein